jgi:hypothetical protein
MKKAQFTAQAETLTQRALDRLTTSQKAIVANTTVRHHCSWSSCSRLYTPDRPGHTYCGHQDCPATTVVPEHGPRR